MAADVYFACLFVRDGNGQLKVYLEREYDYEGPTFPVGTDAMVLYRKFGGGQHVYGVHGRTAYLVIPSEPAERKDIPAPPKIELAEGDHEYLVNVCWEMVTNPDASYVDTLLGIEC